MQTVDKLTVSKPVEVAAPSFETGAAGVLAELGASLRGLLGHLSTPAHRAVDVQGALGLDRKLAWQVFKLAHAAHPLAEADKVPARRSMERLLGAAQSVAPLPVVDRVSAAFDRFEAFVAAQGEDRAGFASMVSGLGIEANPQADLKVRKALFRGNAHVWGVRASTLVRTWVFRPLPGPEHLGDAVYISGSIGLQRVRRGAPLTFNSFMHVSDDPASPVTDNKERAQPSDVPRTIQGVKVLTEYSTQPLPLMVPRADPVGDDETELVFPALGRAEAVTLYTSQLVRGSIVGEQSQYSSNVLVSIPTETLVNEILVPEGMTDPATGRAAVYGRRLAVERVIERRPEDLLPQRESVAFFRALDGLPSVPEAPRHTDAVRHVLGTLGWQGTRFDVYRCRVEYPVLHTLVHVAADTVRR